MKLWGVVVPIAVGSLLIFGILFAAYLHGVRVTNTKWSLNWSDRNAKDQLAVSIAEASERDKEQARQRSINKAIESGQKTIDSAVADAASNRASSNRLRREIEKLTQQLSEIQASNYSCASYASEAATRAALVLAHLLKRADQRAGELAEAADQARSRGLICEASYELVRAP